MGTLCWFLSFLCFCDTRWDFGSASMFTHSNNTRQTFIKIIDDFVKANKESNSALIFNCMAWHLWIWKCFFSRFGNKFDSVKLKLVHGINLRDNSFPKCSLGIVHVVAAARIDKNVLLLRFRTCNANRLNTREIYTRKELTNNICRRQKKFNVRDFVLTLCQDCNGFYERRSLAEQSFRKTSSLIWYIE